MTEHRKPGIGIIRKVDKTLENPHGMVRVREIDTRRPVVVIFGGGLTVAEKQANNYATYIRAALLENGLDDIGVYSIFYSFYTKDDSFYNRVNLFRKAGRKIELDEKDGANLAKLGGKEYSPDMVKQLYDILILPRITNNFGNRIPAKSACRNIRKINIFLHCHGAVVASYLETVMTHEMKNLGYDANEIAEIQQNLLVIAHAPLAPLGKSAFTFLSFATAMDETVEHYNHFHDYAIAHAGDMKPGFFPEQLGNMFLAGKSKLAEDAEEEHAVSGLTKSADSLLTDDGRILYSAERNALINGVRNSTGKNPLPSVGELVSGPGVDFDELKKNGEEFYKTMLKTVRDDERILSQIAKDISKHRD